MRRRVFLLTAIFLGLGASVAENATYPGDVEALVAFRSAIQPPSSWVGSEPCGSAACGGPEQPACAWEGLECSAWRVVSLRLGGLSGTLSPALGALGQLGVLQLQGPELGGYLPGSWGALTNLRQLDVSYTEVDGPLPPSFGGMASLQELYLESNRLSGYLPNEWWQLKSLRVLELSFNSLEGPLPSNWSQLTQLTSVGLEDNQLSGTVPAGWGALAALRLLNVRGNCGICGQLPKFEQEFSPSGLVVLARGSSLGWECSHTNCSAFPLGFVGQAAIVVAVVLMMSAMCCWRRCYMFRRHAPDPEQRSGWGLVRGVLSLRRAPGPPAARGRGEDSDEGSSDEEGPLPKVAPPIVVVMPDGATLCTAKLDPLASLASQDALPLPAADGKPEGPQPGEPGGRAEPSQQQAQRAQQAGGAMARCLPWRRRGADGGRDAAAALELVGPASSAAGQQQQQQVPVPAGLPPSQPAAADVLPPRHNPFGFWDPRRGLFARWDGVGAASSQPAPSQEGEGSRSSRRRGREGAQRAQPAGSAELPVAAAGLGRASSTASSLGRASGGSRTRHRGASRVIPMFDLELGLEEGGPGGEASSRAAAAAVSGAGGSRGAGAGAAAAGSRQSSSDPDPPGPST